MDVKKVIKLIDEAVAFNPKLFLIDTTISKAGDIEIIVDGDSGVSLEECIRISRHVEHNLDREIDDFSLQVTSPDITMPLVHKRQYFKNKGRILQVQTIDQLVEGKLIDIQDDILSLTWKTREPKPIGKGKHTVTKTAEIDIKDILKTTVKIIYN